MHLDEFTILEQPVDCAALIGDKASFSVTAYGDDLTYQWEASRDGVNWTASTAAGSQTDTISGITVTEDRIGRWYRCRVTDTNGTEIVSSHVMIRRPFDTWEYTYNADGLRVGKTNTETTYQYYYNGDKLSRMNVDYADPDVEDQELHFGYDASGVPQYVIYGGHRYFYLTNLQGDVVAIVNTSGDTVVEYTYDAWGNILTTTGTMAATLGKDNPLRYRGYVYDEETKLYYLQSRYYDPAIGRFINADGYTSTGQGLLGNNMFAYCQNCPMVFSDDSGCRMVRRSAAMVGGGTPYIVDQAADSIGQKFLGSSTVAHGGCGVVATYNALVDLGVPTDFDDVLAYYNEESMTRLTLNGWLGILPPVVAQYFVDQGYEVIMADNWDAIDIHSQTADASIMYYMFTNKTSVMPFGAHFVSYRGVGNQYVGMNTAENNGVFYFALPSEYGHQNNRFYSLGIFVYK